MQNDNLELSKKVLIIWNLNQMKKNEFSIDEDFNKQSFIAQILRKKMEAFNIKINIPDELIMLIEIATNSNPGVSQVMLHEILMSIRDLKEGYTIQPMDFARKYPDRFLMMDNPEDEEYFRKLWDAQKSPSGNRCDTVEYWMECFNK